MGVITKLLFRGDSLQLAPHRNLFLDMEENIHIHYRDLRIELSRGEFEEIVSTFSKQSKELLDIIYKSNYEDGKLPNSNQEDTRIWTQSRLNHPVKYHPKRISIEKCTDGYHLHIRNYKLLLNEADFKSFYQIIKLINLDAPYASTIDEVVQLFNDNDMDFLVTQTDRVNNICNIKAASYHMSKIRTICEKIGMSKEGNDKRYHFKNVQQTLIVSSVSGHELADVKKLKSAQSLTLLARYISENKQIDKDLLNHIKCQVLNLFGYVKTAIEQDKKIPDVDLDYLSWSYNSQENKVTFPFKVINDSFNMAGINSIYRKWSIFLQQQELFFIKPTKVEFNHNVQAQSRHNIYTELAETLTHIDGVSKIYLMGSIIRKTMGLYLSPFVHSQWAKLGSDVDILIEMEDFNAVIPEHWEYINVSSSNDCDIYHLSQVPLVDSYGFQKEFPHIKFFHHLLDAFVYIPSKSDFDKKEAFLKKFAAQLFYSKNKSDVLAINFNQTEVEDPWGKKQQPENSTITTTQTVKNDDKLAEIKSLLLDTYQLKATNLAKIKAATENEIYHFLFAEQAYILKCYKVSGNYRSSRIDEHTHYEAEFVDSLSDSTLNIAKLLKNKNADVVSYLGETPAIVYSYAQGRIFKYPDPFFPITEVTQCLSVLHQLQLNKPLQLSQKFLFDDVFNIWYPEFYRFMNEYSEDVELSRDFSKLKKIYKQIKTLYHKISNDKKIPWLHNHGDVTPRNFVINKGVAAPIDFQNSFYGPRLLDVIDGAYEFSFAGKPPGKNDFSRFKEFTSSYQSQLSLTHAEINILDDVIKVCGIIKFIKEVRMIKGDSNKNNLRRQRALSVSKFLIERYL